MTCVYVCVILMYTYVGRDNKLRRCIVPLTAPPWSSACIYSPLEQNRYVLTSLMIIYKHHSVHDLC